MNEYILYTSLFDSYLHPRIKPAWFYRVVQKFLELIGLYTVYYFYGIDTVAGCLVCHYFMVMDRLYYLIRSEEYVVQWYEGAGKVPDWLNRWYFSGLWLFRNYFTMHKFDLSAVSGFLIGYIIIKFNLVTILIAFLKTII